MVVNITISNKVVYLLVGLLVLVGVGGLVVAFDGNQPDVHGHDANEIDNIPVAQGQVGIIYWGNVDNWMTDAEYTGSEVCTNIGKNCISVYGTSRYNGYYASYTIDKKLCGEDIVVSQWSSDGFPASIGGSVTEWLAVCG